MYSEPSGQNSWYELQEKINFSQFRMCPWGSKKALHQSSGWHLFGYVMTVSAFPTSYRLGFWCQPLFS